MKKFKTFILTLFLTSGAFLYAAPSFSGLLAGSAGLRADIPHKDGDEVLYVPIAGLAAGQLSFTDWCILRAELEMRANNFAFVNLFDGSDATLKVHEVSLMFTSRTVTMTNFFSLFLGSYEPIGSDTFLMRQFGIEPISSPLVHSTTSLSGISLYPTTGAGISYIIHFDKAPIATGGYLYLNKDDDNDLTLNLDLRLAFVTQIVTMDFSAGIGAPLQNKYKNEDVVLMIETINLHGGLNLFLGNKYTHGFLLQMGVSKFTLTGGSPQLDGDCFSFIVEPRLNMGACKMNMTFYALEEDSVEELLYLTERVGFAISAFKDDIEIKNGMLTFGVHAICSLGNTNFLDLCKGGMSDVTINTFLTPFVKLPLSPATQMEAMTQFGLFDITGESRFNFKIVAGFRRTF